MRVAWFPMASGVFLNGLRLRLSCSGCRKPPESMLPFLRGAIPYGRHIINAISPSTLQHQLCLQTQWFSMRYANSNASNGNSFTVSYLIDTCGFSPQEAEAASKRVSFETREKPDLVIKFLKSHGFSRLQILHFIKSVPEFLRFDPEKTFMPKIEFFKSRGVSSSHIPRLVCNCPNIMRRSLSNHLIPSFDFLRDLLGSDEKLVKALQYCSAILVDSKASVLHKIELLREARVPQSNIIKFLQFYSRSLAYSTGRFKKIVEEVKELGFDPWTFQFLMAVHVSLSSKESARAKKVYVYKKWGWSDNDILAAFRRLPICMTLSEDQIDAKLEFLVHKLGCNPSMICTYPNVLGYSLKKRIVPRGAVLQVLLSKGLLKSETLLAKFALTEKDFLRRVVLCHVQEEASELMELYLTKLDQAR
ncbi:transcription termination factor MTERF8, chloroplastic-like [Neltuma alba]|uniref:transcription termination factor MTERF8, chloroplastic-like n=1 Tax=Neltuma alba TaxID=207710 RepID=UPI0010A3E967|nr:transcription termination factor MTERF8, chloroplastic-like [Prosopis alba]XP_028753363.1 transcription termination factor MTERF8, chloroplastic-like [Prosopis alba]XP_028755441.1 transcription termination factor MTERF8, chloroplastic-like [Prosopis alba]XP_028755442.1 transcription termination factor MTERF8, chloroplastic-like [Prosopis alba]